MTPEELMGDIGGAEALRCFSWQGGVAPHELVEEFSGAEQIDDDLLAGGAWSHRSSWGTSVGLRHYDTSVWRVWTHRSSCGTSVGLRHCDASVGRRVWLPHELVEEVSGAEEIGGDTQLSEGFGFMPGSN